MTSFEKEIELFLDERRRLGYSRNYLVSQKRCLELLQTSLKARGRPVEPQAVVEGDLLAVLESERTRGLSENTVHSITTAFRVFFASLCRKGRILLDPARNLENPANHRTLGYVPTPGDVQKLLEACDIETDHGLRNRAILELLYGSGMRMREVINLDVRDVDLVERTAFIKNAKGRKDRIVPLTEAAAKMIARYIEEVRPRTSHPALFASASGGRFEATNWRGRQLRPLVRELGLPRELRPHRLRHACAVHLLQNGADLRHIQKLLGHAGLNSTEIYLTLDIVSLRKTHEHAHPREKDVRSERGTESGPPAASEQPEDDRPEDE